LPPAEPPPGFAERLIRPLAAKLGSIHVSRRAAGTATVLAWLLAAWSWVGLYRMTDRGSGLGWDLLTTWRAEKVFAHGGAPYAVKAFLYPPSCLLLLRPLGSLTRHQLTVGGLVVTLVVAWVSVMLGALALGRKWWGLTAAVTVWLLHFTEAMRGELSLENVTVLGALALTCFYLFALRGHWMAAGAAIGVSLAIKPLLVVVLLVFVLARQWKALALAVAIPAVLNVVGFLVVADPGQVWSKLPSLLNRSGFGINFNSAWVDVVRTLGLPVGVSWLLRLTTVGVALAAALLAWRRCTDERQRLVTTASALLIGSFLAGTLSEYHFMLTLVPLAMTVSIPRSPVRTVTGAVGMIWTMGVLIPPSALLGLNLTANHSAFRAFGMSLVLITTLVLLVRRRPGAVTTQADRAGTAGSSEAPAALSGVVHA
jgi:arabinofuranan 3-O-arabinosyltransferase